jgi:hypothetical protein
LLDAGNNALAQKADALVLGRFERREGFNTLCVLTNERQLAIADAENIRPAQRLGSPVPGDAKILAVRLVGRGCEVLLDNGVLHGWQAQGWTRVDRFPVSDLILGGVERKADSARRWWCVTAEREVFVADRGLDDAVSLGFVDGVAPVLALKLFNARVYALDSDGDLCAASARKPATAGDDPPEAA